MKWTNAILPKFILLSAYFFVFVCTPVVKVYGQTNTYSPAAQKILDDYNSSKAEDDDDLDIFKFSINNILNSEGDIVEKPAGTPSIFGRTDYGSEFFLENELSTTFSIEIPAFVIDNLAETDSDDYFPIIRDGISELEIDFKDLYDTENGEVITPEMGFVKLIDDPATYGLDQFKDNLSDGELLEFFVRPSNKYLTKHNRENLFFINRPIPTNPIIAEIDIDGNNYNTTDGPSSDAKPTIYVGPGEEAFTSPNGEIRVYVTSVYVQAPASKFFPTQIVMPVKSDGTYIYDDEPRAAETFSDDQAVVAIPEQEAERLSKKVKEIKKEKETPTNPKHDEDTPPALDPGKEMMIKLNNILTDVQKGPNRLLSETKKIIQKEFPNISEQLIDFFINTANSNEKFEFIEDPRGFLDNELAKISNPIDLNLLLNSNLPQEELIKVYNLVLYKFSSDLTALGFDKVGNQEIDFSVNIKNADQILEQVQLQQDTIAILPLLGSNRGNQGLSNLLIEPKEVDPNSSNALFGSRKSQKVLDQIKLFSEVITFINSPPTIAYDSAQILNDTLPVVEVKVGIDESIAKALEEKLVNDKSLNRSFQPRSLSSQLGKFNFELPEQETNSEPTSSTSILAASPNISDKELQIIAEITEATNNILDSTIEKMLTELGDETLETSSIEIAPVSNDIAPSNEETIGASENRVLNSALSSAQRLKEIEDIRAIFQILGVGS